MKRAIKIHIEKTSTGYSAFAEKYPVYSTGQNVKQLTANMVDALNLYFEETKEKRAVTSENLTMMFSIASLFELYPINLKQFADRVGINYTLLSQYVRGRKRPSEKQTEKIVHALKEVGRELSEVRLE